MEKKCNVVSINVLNNSLIFVFVKFNRLHNHFKILKERLIKKYIKYKGIASKLNFNCQMVTIES